MLESTSDVDDMFTTPQKIPFPTKPKGSNATSRYSMNLNTTLFIGI